MLDSRFAQTVRIVQTVDMSDRTMSASEARDQLPEALNRVAYSGERVIIERRGRKVAAIVSMEDLELLRRIEDEADVADAKKALRQRSKAVPYTQARETLGLVKPPR